jgi:hypothetical protein
MELTIDLNLLGKLCNNVGGAAHVHKLLPPLELLICGEDNNVRNQVGDYSQWRYCAAMK